MERLPGVPELGDRPLLAGRYEDRVVAETLVPAALVRDRPLEDPGPPELAAVRGQCDELADVAGAAIGCTVELGQKLRDPVLGPPRRLDSRPAAERDRLDPGVLAEDPGARFPHLAPEAGLSTRVLVVRLSVLGRKCVRAEQLDLPAGQCRPQLVELVRVARRELRPARR